MSASYSSDSAAAAATTTLRVSAGCATLAGSMPTNVNEGAATGALRRVRVCYGSRHPPVDDIPARAPVPALGCLQHRARTGFTWSTMMRIHAWLIARSPPRTGPRRVRAGRPIIAFVVFGIISCCGLLPAAGDERRTRGRPIRSDPQLRAVCRPPHGAPQAPPQTYRPFRPLRRSANPRDPILAPHDATRSFVWHDPIGFHQRCWSGYRPLAPLRRRTRTGQTGVRPARVRLNTFVPCTISARSTTRPGHSLSGRDDLSSDDPASDLRHQSRRMLLRVGSPMAGSWIPDPSS